MQKRIAIVLFLFFFNNLLSQSGIFVSGIVTDNSGNGIPNIIVRLSTNDSLSIPFDSTITDENGYYIIDNITGVDDDPMVPKTFKLYQNYPNSFKDKTNIVWESPVNLDEAVITIYTLPLVQEVVKLRGSAYRGLNGVQWDGRNSQGQQVASQNLLAILEAGDYKAVMKMNKGGMQDASSLDLVRPSQSDQGDEGVYVALYKGNQVTAGETHKLTFFDPADEYIENDLFTDLSNNHADITLTKLLTVNGMLVNDMKYEKLNDVLLQNAAMEGIIEVDGQTIHTDNNGNFTFRIPENRNGYAVKAQAFTDGTAVSFKPTFYLTGDKSIDDLILHVTPFQPILEMGFTPQDFFDFAMEANFGIGPGAGYEGLKKPKFDTAEDEVSPYHAAYASMSVEEKQFLATFLADSVYSYSQLPIPISIASSTDTLDSGRTDGYCFWLKITSGSAGLIGQHDYDSDGTFDYSGIFIKFVPGYPVENAKGAIRQEGFSRLFAPWPVYDQRFSRKSVVSEVSFTPGPTNIDLLLNRIVENYEQKKPLDEILDF